MSEESDIIGRVYVELERANGELTGLGSEIRLIRSLGIRAAPQRTTPPGTQSGDLCIHCGGLMIQSGTCYTCTGCGETTGCG